MSEIIQFHLVNGVDLEKCRFFYGDGNEFDENESMAVKRFLASCCAERHSPDMVIAIENSQINNFLNEKNYLVRVAHFLDVNCVFDKVAELGASTILYVLLVGPNRPISSTPVPAGKGFICLKIIEALDKDAQIVMFY